MPNSGFAIDSTEPIINTFPPQVPRLEPFMEWVARMDMDMEWISGGYGYFFVKRFGVEWIMG